MENRLQYVFLKASAVLFFAVGSSAALSEDELAPISGSASSIDSEFFEIGANTGILNIQDFGSEMTTGLYVSFKATEDFFLQFNYQEAEVDLSSYEKDRNIRYFSGADRKFVHYDLLVGYNLFQAEYFYGSSKSNLATLYFVGGVGDTEFGGEASLTYTLGLGYEIVFARRLVVRVDYRDHIYKSNLIIDDRTAHNSGFTFGAGYLF